MTDRSQTTMKPGRDIMREASLGYPPRGGWGVALRGVRDDDREEAQGRVTHETRAGAACPLRTGDILMGDKWLFNNRVCVSAHHYPMWKRGGFGFHENGGRDENEVFDATFVVGRHNLSFTLWHIGKWTRLLRWVPRHHRRGWALYVREPRGA